MEPTSTTTHSGRDRGVLPHRGPLSKVAWFIALTVAIVLAAVTAALGIATLIPGLGLLSSAASVLAPTIAPHLVLLGVTVLAIGYFAMRHGLKRSGLAAAAIGGVGLVTNIAVVSILAFAITGAGGSVNLLSATFGLSAMGAEEPDAVEVYNTTSTGEDLSLSIYEPAQSSGPAPTIMFVHGGGWTFGEPDTLSSELRSLADDGYLVVSVEYELATATKPTWDKAPAQVACAASWIEANADALGADMDRLAFWGESAGGNLAINTAGSAAQGSASSSCEGTVPVPSAVVADFPGVDVSSIYDNSFDQGEIKARSFATNYTGGSPERHPKRYTAVNSSTHLSSDAPQTLVMTPTRDDLVDPDDQHEWADAAREQGVDVETVDIPLANHAYPQLAKNSLGSQGHMSIATTYLAERLK